MRLYILSAFVVGASLGTAGCVLQSVLRNPLAEPYILGLVGGGSLFVAAAIHFGLTAYSALVLPVSSFCGSCFSLALVCMVASFAARRRTEGSSAARLRSSGTTIILAGFVTASFTCSLQMLLLSYSEPATMARVTQWMFGDVRDVRPAALACGAVTLAVVLAGLLHQAKLLNVLELGRDEAECLGIDTRRVKLVSLGLVSLATAIAVALAGPVGFVGLVVPNFVNRCFGGLHRRRILLSAFFGGLALVVAAIVGRMLPGDISAGVVCALVGSPLFLYLLAVPPSYQPKSLSRICSAGV